MKCAKRVLNIVEFRRPVDVTSSAFPLRNTWSYEKTLSILQRATASKLLMLRATRHIFIFTAILDLSYYF